MNKFNNKISFKYMNKYNKNSYLYKHYLHIYKNMNPIEISNKTYIFYDKNNNFFIIKFIYTIYYISFPDYNIYHINNYIGIYLLETSIIAKVFVIRFLIKWNLVLYNKKFLTYHEINNYAIYYRQFYNRCLSYFSHCYENKIFILNKIVKYLKERKYSYGDYSYRLNIVNNLYIKFILWNGDNEFKSSSQILFSNNFSIMFTYEDLLIISNICINFIKNIEKIL